MLLTPADSPRVSCPRFVEAILGELDVIIECDVIAKPSVTDVFWLVDENGTSLRPKDDDDDDGDDDTVRDFTVTRSVSERYEIH